MGRTNLESLLYTRNYDIISERKDADYRKQSTSCKWSTINENLAHFLVKAHVFFSTRQERKYMIKWESGIKKLFQGN